MISQGKGRVMCGGGGDQNKWLSTSNDPICREICVLSALMVASGRSIQKRSLFLAVCLPPFPLIGYHGQVTKGEVNGGVKSTRGHGYIDGKPHCLPERLLALWSYGH